MLVVLLFLFLLLFMYFSIFFDRAKLRPLFWGLAAYLNCVFLGRGCNIYIKILKRLKLVVVGETSY